MWNSVKKVQNNQLQISHNLRTSTAATIIKPTRNSLVLDKINGDLTITKLYNNNLPNHKFIKEGIQTKMRHDSIKKSSSQTSAISNRSRTLPESPDFFKNLKRISIDNNSLDSSLTNKTKPKLLNNQKNTSLNQNFLPILPQIRNLRLEKTPFLNRTILTSSITSSSDGSNQSTYILSNKLTNKQKLQMSHQQWSSLSTTPRHPQQQYISSSRLVNNLTGSICGEELKIPQFYSLIQPQSPKTSQDLVVVEDAPKNFYYNPNNQKHSIFLTQQQQIQYNQMKSLSLEPFQSNYCQFKPLIQQEKEKRASSVTNHIHPIQYYPNYKNFPSQQNLIERRINSSLNNPFYGINREFFDKPQNRSDFSPTYIPKIFHSSKTIYPQAPLITPNIKKKKGKQQFQQSFSTAS